MCGASESRSPTPCFACLGGDCHRPPFDLDLQAVEITHEFIAPLVVSIFLPKIREVTAAQALLTLFNKFELRVSARSAFATGLWARPPAGLRIRANFRRPACSAVIDVNKLEIRRACSAVIDVDQLESAIDRDQRP